jgi:mRNA-decapping enzyme subunit 2
MNPNHYIDSVSSLGKLDRLYLIRGVDYNYPFGPRTNYEIQTIAWFSIDGLPEHKQINKNDFRTITREKKKKKDTRPNQFFLIFPYIK